MSTTREALEASLVRFPDDVTLHMAYADCLIEEGDPRGEWIRLCLAKEQPDIDSSVKRKIDNAIRRIRSANISTWNGPFSSYPVYPSFGAQDVKPEMLIRWKRGWIWHFQATPYDQTVIDLVLKHPYLRLLHTLILFRSQWARHPGPPVQDFAFLRELQISSVKIFHLCDRQFDDHALAHLLAAPYFPSIRDLSLSWTSLTDAGAAMLVDHPHTAQLRVLSLGSTAMTPAGCDLFRSIGKRITNYYPHIASDPDYSNDSVTLSGPG